MSLWKIGRSHHKDHKESLWRTQIISVRTHKSILWVSKNDCVWNHFKGRQNHESLQVMLGAHKVIRVVHTLIVKAHKSLWGSLWSLWNSPRVNLRAYYSLWGSHRVNVTVTKSLWKWLVIKKFTQIYCEGIHTPCQGSHWVIAREYKVIVSVKLSHSEGHTVSKWGLKHSYHVTHSHYEGS